jgi:hypothetical protein
MPLGRTFAFALALLAVATLAGAPIARAQDTATPAPGGVVEEGRYLSPTYRYLVAWFEPWTLVEDQSAGETDTLRLVAGASTADLTAAPAPGADAGACLAGVAADLEADPAHADVVLAQQLDGRTIPGGDPASLLGIFTYTARGDGASPVAMNAIAHCRPLAGEAMLRILLTTPADQWDATVDALIDLLDGVVPAIPPGDPAWPQPPVHIERGQDHEPYATNPPTSGPHIGGEIVPWGVSSTPVEDEVVVHNLEHGGVVLYHNCDCPEAIAILERLADPATGYPVKVIAAPNPTMDAEIALTAWHYLWTLDADEVTEERIRAFIDAHIDRGFEHIAAESAQLDAWRAGQPATPAP